MLTADLVQARVYRKEVRPRYIDTADEGNLALAGELIDVFAAHEGRPRHELNLELRELLGTGTEFLLHRALAKLLLDRSTFDTESEVEPEELRRQVFESAADVYQAPGEDAAPSFDREAALAAVAGRLELEPRQIERGLYADLKDEQILTEWKRCQPGWLLERYNVALAQGVLFKATELEINIDGGDIRQHRELFRKIKFFQLMHQVESPKREQTGHYLIRLDGPLSVFKSSGRYGLQMASFLPTLLHFDHWSLTAKLLWGKKRRELGFRLSPATGLKPYTRLTGQWQPEALTFLPDQFGKLESEWRISTDAELINLGGRGVLVPDYLFEHSSGLHVYMEAFGFWNKGAVASRLDLLRQHGPKNLILAISKQLAVGREGLDELPGDVYVFRAAPLARKVLKLLEQHRGACLDQSSY